MSCEQQTLETIEHHVISGNHTVAGNGFATHDWPPSNDSTDDHIWVDATTTYLPIQATSTEHLTGQTMFTWLPATAVNTATLNINIPAVF